jgi:hypothetical protein
MLISDVLQNAANPPQIGLNSRAARPGEVISARETKAIVNQEDAERRSYESTVQKVEVVEVPFDGPFHLQRYGAFPQKPAILEGIGLMDCC